MNNEITKKVVLKVNYEHLEFALVPYLESMNLLPFESDNDILSFDIPVSLNDDGLVEIEVSYI